MPAMPDRLLIIIPAWNEEVALPGVIAEVQATVGAIADIVVVSDGSTDRTAALARQGSPAALRGLARLPWPCKRQKAPPPLRPKKNEGRGKGTAPRWGPQRQGRDSDDDVGNEAAGLHGGGH